jgi:hypothetical protein
MFAFLLLRLSKTTIKQPDFLFEVHKCYIVKKINYLFICVKVQDVVWVLCKLM